MKEACRHCSGLIKQLSNGSPWNETTTSKFIIYLWNNLFFQVSESLGFPWTPIPDAELHPAIFDPHVDAETAYLSMLHADQQWWLVISAFQRQMALVRVPAMLQKNNLEDGSNSWLFLSRVQVLESVIMLFYLYLYTLSAKYWSLFKQQNHDSF